MNGRYTVVVTGATLQRLVVWATSLLDAEHKATQARGILDPAVTSVAIKCGAECVARWRRWFDWPVVEEHRSLGLAIPQTAMWWVKVWGTGAVTGGERSRGWWQAHGVVVAAGCGGGAGSDAIG